MKDMMPDISFERSMNHNYMILSRCNFFENKNDRATDYRVRMLLENHIPGLLPVTHRMMNGESRYYYEINSLQSLDRLYDKSEIGYEGLKRLLSGIVSLFERLEEYLLDGTQIIIRPELIYVDVENMAPYFVCYPEYEGEVRLAFMEFIDKLLTKIDHTDERAVMLGYQVYRYTRNPNYVIGEIGRMMEHAIVERVRADVAAGNTVTTPHAPDRRQEEARYGGAPEEKKVPFIYNNDAIYKNDDENDEDSDADGSNGRTSGREKPAGAGDFIGGIFCLFVSLCAGGIVLGARLIGSVKLSASHELYLCGAMGMALTAAVLFFLCYIKKRKQDKMIEALNGDGDEEDDDDDIYYSRPQYFGGTSDMPQSGSSFWDVQNFQDKNERCQAFYDNKEHGHSAAPETICLGDSAVEERVLYGRMDGKEVSVPLDRLPMTVGKLASVADFVINDTAVSKMHARFEERGGRVYLCDLNSTNGTVRNGQLLGVNQSVKLEPGDRLRFGRTCFTYC